MHLKKSIKYLVAIMLSFYINLPYCLAASNSCNYFFGDVKNPDELAYYLSWALKLIQIAGPIMAIVLILIDGLKAITGPERDIMGKFLHTSLKRIIYALLLFVVPTVLDSLFKLFSIYGTCIVG